jgi:serine/threonine-protein kinase
MTGLVMGADVLVADRYRLDQPLGRGGMGEVWQAVDETLHRPVAVKLMAADPDPQMTARFHAEARAAARLNHPNLVTAFDFGDHDGRLYLVMELVEGHNLGQELAAQSRLEPSRAADIAAQAARGLAAAHQQAVVHRDIKPSNLMLAADGTVKVADFGLAQLVDEAAAALTATGRVMGTSLYLAPERALGRPAGPATDVYSLGCVLYQMLTGQPPFQGDSPISIVHQHVEKTPAPAALLHPGLPEPLSEYLPAMLAKAPEDRPTADEIADWLSGPLEPATAPDVAPAATAPIVAHRRPGAKARRSRKTTLVACAVGSVAFGAAVAVGTAATSGGHQPTSPTLPPSSPMPSTAPTTIEDTAPSTTQSPSEAAPPQDRDHDGHGKRGKK